MTTGQQYMDVQGIDFVLPAAPPLTLPPLSLLGEAATLIDTDGMVARRQQLIEKVASAQEQLERYDMGEFDVPGEEDSAEDARKALEQQMSEWNTELQSLVSDLARMQGWEHGFEFLPELSNAPTVMSTYTEDGAGTKPTGNNQNLFGWYDPFLAVGLDSRSLFGWPNTDMADRVQRASRALVAHEAWQAEREFWTGTAVPTNLHLTASPDSGQSSPHRTLVFPFPLPTPTPGTVLGVKESLSDSLASLDQAIAAADAGSGMIHASCYVVQKWSQVYPFLRDARGNIRTVNGNLLVPGYGYPGTGPDQMARSVDDGATTDGDDTLGSATAAFTGFDVGQPVEGVGIPDGTVIASVTDATHAIMSQDATADGSGVTITLPGTGGDASGQVLQWAYATDMVYHLRGDIMTYPLDLREMSPDVPVNNDAEARAERSHALITNGLVRAAVLVDTGTP